MMLPDRHIHIDAQRLQALWDAERDQSAFARLRDDLRALRPAGEPSPLYLVALFPLLTLLAALLAALVRGMA